MTSFRGSQTTLLHPQSSGRTLGQTYQTLESRSPTLATFHFNQSGHPYFEGGDRGPPDMDDEDLKTHEHAFPKESRPSDVSGRDAISHHHSSIDSLRNQRSLEFDNFPRIPEKSHQRKRARQPSSLWIRDSEGRQIIEIGLKEGRYVAGPSDGAVEEDEEEEPGDVEKNIDEEKGNEGPPKPVGFWDRSLNKTRLEVFKRWAIMTTILSVFILAVLSLFWAVLFDVGNNLNSIVVFVVNFETQPDALVGPLVTQMTESIVETNQMPHLGYITIPPSAYNNDHLQVREAIYQEEAFAAIVVNSNATTLLRQAVETGNSSYDPTGAIQLIYNEARDQDSYYNYVYPNIQELQAQISAEFGQKWAAQVFSNSSIDRANLEKAPQAVSPGIGFSTFQLRPFVPYTALPAVSIGLIYLIIVSFFSFSFFLPIHMRFVGPGHPPLKFYQVIVWRWCATIAAYLILSLFYSIVPLAFQFPFTNAPGSQYVSVNDPTAFGAGTFPVYWMINFVGMIALGMACENVAMIVGMPWTALWLIFWVITNVSTSFYAIETSPGFFRWGYAWPLHNIVEASRTVLFDLHSKLGLNFGILFAWAAVNTVLFPFCCWFMRWKNIRAMKKSKGQ